MDEVPRWRRAWALSLAMILVTSPLGASPAWAGEGAAVEAPAEADAEADAAAGAEAETEAEADEGAGSSADGYAEQVDVGWEDPGPEQPSSGPTVTIEVHDHLRPVYLLPAGTTEGSAAALCEAPCNRRVGDLSGQFVLDGPRRNGSKPFGLSGGDSLRLVTKGGNPKRKTQGIVVIALSAVTAIGLAITPTRVNMRRGMGFTLWGAAGVIGLGGIGSGVALIRFSRTQVKVLSE